MLKQTGIHHPAAIKSTDYWCPAQQEPHRKTLGAKPVPKDHTDAQKKSSDAEASQDIRKHKTFSLPIRASSLPSSFHCASAFCVNQTSPTAEILAQPQRRKVLLCQTEHAFLHPVRGHPPLALYVQMFLMDFMSNANTSPPLKTVIGAEPKCQTT